MHPPSNLGGGGGVKNFRKIFAGGGGGGVRNFYFGGVDHIVWEGGSHNFEVKTKTA